MNLMLTKKIQRNKLAFIILMSILTSANAWAGNEDRAGQAGAGELLINPWARAGSWNNANSGFVHGVESFNSNIGGLSFIKGTEIVFAHTEWLKGSKIRIESLGFGQKVGESGALGISIMSMGFGEIERTTEAQPDGGAGTFSPQFINIGLAYSKEFSNSIHGGLAIKIISEDLGDAKAQGICLDAGIQYVTGFNKERDNLKFGIALRNVGAPLRYQGEGLAYRNTTINVLEEQITEKFELPSLVNIGAAYDIKFGEDNRITPALNFTSNSFIRDQFALGAEYGFKNILMIRVAYAIDRKDKNAIVDEEISSLIGASAGVSFQIPIGKSGKTFGIDYGYRSTKTFDGTHTFGVRFNL